MIMQGLQGKTVLLTRPEATAGDLADRIVKLGARALYLPSIVIAPTENKSTALAVLEDLKEFDILIFVSRNAVKYACQIIPDLVQRISEQLVFVIGTGTSEELSRRGVSKVSFSHGNTGSEALLDMPELQAARVSEKKVLILRGTGGRELLREVLSKRGARVQYADLYRRMKPELQADEVSRIWLEAKPDVVQVTSAEGLSNLLSMSGEKERSRFLQTRLIVISPRLKAEAEARGFSAEIKVTRAYSDDDFILALRDMFEATENE